MSRERGSCGPTSEFEKKFNRMLKAKEKKRGPSQEHMDQVSAEMERDHLAQTERKQPEGIFFVKTKGVWAEIDCWPKGRTRARISATRNGETSFVSAVMSKAEAYKKVWEEFISAEKKKDHGYERFAVVPQTATEMDEAAKSRLRKARDAKKTVPAEEC